MITNSTSSWSKVSPELHLIMIIFRVRRNQFKELITPIYTLLTMTLKVRPDRVRFSVRHQKLPSRVQRCRIRAFSSFIINSNRVGSKERIVNSLLRACMLVRKEGRLTNRYKSHLMSACQPFWEKPKTKPAKRSWPPAKKPWKLNIRSYHTSLEGVETKANFTQSNLSDSANQIL